MSWMCKGVCELASELPMSWHRGVWRECGRSVPKCARVCWECVGMCISVHGVCKGELDGCTRGEDIDMMGSLFG